MLDLENETPLTLNEARRLPYLKGRRGNQISLCTMNRWRTRGVGGIVLETAKSGGTVITTTEAVLRFVHRLNNPESSTAASHCSQHRRAIAEADRKLDQAGI